MHFLTTLTTLLLPALVSAHGYVSSPAARTAGSASDAACGKKAMDDIRHDNTSHVEGLPELAAQDADFKASACNLWLCKGMQFGDNKMNVQSYAAGDKVDIKVRLTIPHDGWANVSIVDTATNAVIGDMLKVWDKGYANEKAFYAGSLDADQTAFSVTLPDVAKQCSEAGKCVIQWFWWGVGAKQTYESCIDFVMKA